MAKVSGIAASLDVRLKHTVKVYGLDIDALAGRTLAEAVLRYWHLGMGQSPIELKGGLLFDQRVRPTSDADVTAIRRYLPHEIHRGMLVIRSLLQAEGMDIEFLADSPQLIDVGHGNPVERWFVRGSVGGVRANSQLDITLGRGCDAFSRVAEFTEIPPLIAKLPALTIACQPLEAAAAEKLLAVIDQPDTDMRVKHLADIIDERLWDGVDCGLVARELQRVCRHRSIDPTELPANLEVSDFECLRDNWSKHFRPAMPTMAFVQAIENANYLWSEVQDCMSPSHRPQHTTIQVAVQRRIGGMR